MADAAGQRDAGKQSSVKALFPTFLNFAAVTPSIDRSRKNFKGIPGDRNQGIGILKNSKCPQQNHYRELTSSSD
jgi:hypothetical protein